MARELFEIAEKLGHCIAHCLLFSAALVCIALVAWTVAKIVHWIGTKFPKDAVILEAAQLLLLMIDLGILFKIAYEAVI